MPVGNPDLGKIPTKVLRTLTTRYIIQTAHCACAEICDGRQEIDLLCQGGTHLIDWQRAGTARYDAQMKIELDPEGLQVSMGLWRKATDMEIPLAPHLRSHFLTRRGNLLEGFVKISKNWTMLLEGCKATGDDLVALDALRVVYPVAVHRSEESSDPVRHGGFDVRRL